MHVHNVRLARHERSSVGIPARDERREVNRTVTSITYTVDGAPPSPGTAPAHTGTAADTPDRAAPLGLVLESLGTSFLSIVAGRLSGASRVSSVCLFDPFDECQTMTDAIVLGIGTIGVEAVDELIDLAAGQGAAAVILRDTSTLSAEGRAAAAAGGLVVLGLVPGVSWSQVAASLDATLDRELARRAESDAAEVGEPGADELPDLANAVGRLLHAPVTIEDLNSRVLAFSDDQTTNDAGRLQTILHRAVPEELTREMKRRGIFRAVYNSPAPVVINSVSTPRAVASPRVAIRITSRRRILGSIWVATDEPVDPVREEVLVRAAARAGDLLDRMAEENSDGTNRRKRWMARLFAGGRDTRLAIAERHLEDHGFFVYTAKTLDTADRSTQLGEARELARVAESLELVLDGAHANAVAAALGTHVFGVLPVPLGSPPDEAHAESVGRHFAELAGRHGSLIVTLSDFVDRAAELPEAHRDGIASTTTVSRARSLGPGGTFVRVRDTYFDAALLEMRDRLLARARSAPTPVTRLIAHDEEHATQFTATLQTYLAEFGSAARVAAALHIHPNTLRYRLKRIRELFGIDVEEADSRFRTMVELRLLSLH